MYKESTLDNGLKILTYEDTSIPVVDIQILLRAGSRYEEGHQKGYAHILEHMLMKGTVRHPSPVLIAKEVDDKGGYRNAFTSRQRLLFLIQAADNYAEELFELLSDMIFHSLLDPVILENEKKIIVEELKKADDNIDSFFSRFIYEKIFSGHPLASNILGDTESILSATTDELKTYKEKFLVPHGSTLIVCGNISHERAVKAAEKYFGEWQGGLDNIPPVELKPIQKKSYFQPRDTKQTMLACNFCTVPASKPREFLALDLIRIFLNYGSSSLLIEELRHKRGLVYSVAVNNAAFEDAGFFSIKTSTTKPKEALLAIMDIVSNMKNLFREDLLEGIKQRRIGAFKRYIANPYNQALFLSEGFLNAGRLVIPEEYLAEIQSISYQEILDAIDAYLVPDKAVITAIGPQDFLS